VKNGKGKSMNKKQASDSEDGLDVEDEGSDVSANDTD
jgi:hypothetical protein